MLKILIIIALITNISIKMKIFRFNKIRFYKNTSENKYLR